MSKIISVNAGSSSLKFQLYEMPAEEVLTSGVFERIGFDDAIFTIKVKGEKIQETLAIKNHQIEVNILLDALIKYQILDDLNDISGVGHRIVHGAEHFDASILVDADVVAKVEDIADLAPLHNPANLVGYNSFKEALVDAKHVFVFDTAFHQSMDPTTFLYPLPYEIYQDYKVRRYGFHGTSHLYVSKRVAELMNKPVESLNIISCHLGNGASLTAIKGGKSINTSMGFTPLSGVMMGTRTGDVDASIVTYLMEKMNITAQEVIDIFNKKSGMLGVSGLSSDARDVEAAYLKGDQRAILTRKMYAQRIAGFIGSYFVQLGSIDAIVFTAGLGENDISVRADIMDLIKEPLGVEYSSESNNVRGKETKISTPNSKIDVWLVPTDEELVIARDTYKIMVK
ncbi:MAG: acetate/propionate family kinase [Erysipelotrichaceae bacterium]